jgi:hypothetical protein
MLKEEILLRNYLTKREAIFLSSIGFEARPSPRQLSPTEIFNKKITSIKKTN